MTGWYPDPGGRPDRYRYWDGRSWSEETATDPADPPPGSPGRPRIAPTDDRRYNGAALGVAALALVVVVVSTVVIIRRTADVDPFGTAAAGTTPTASSWNDGRSLPGAASPGAIRTMPGDGSTYGKVSCPVGEPAKLAPHPLDGRVHGGRLIMAKVPGYSAPAPEYMLSWMSDTEGVSQTTEPGWQSIFAVGELQRSTDFDTVEAAAHSSMECAMRTDWYLHLTGHKAVRDEPTSVAGHRAWILTWDVYDDTPGLSVPGDQLSFVAVDDGRTDAFSMWCGMVPLDDTARMALDDKVLAELQVGG